MFQEGEEEGHLIFEDPPGIRVITAFEGNASKRGWDSSPLPDGWLDV